MLEKLNYLSHLKNSMGEEMAEMMSDEIEKVMTEQKHLEEHYRELVASRS